MLLKVFGAGAGRSSSFLLTCLLTKECWECRECTALLNREGDTCRVKCTVEAWPLSLTSESASHCASSSQAFPDKWCLKHVIRVIVAVGCQWVAQKFWKPSFLSLTTRQNLRCWRRPLSYATDNMEYLCLSSVAHMVEHLEYIKQFFEVIY